MSDLTEKILKLKDQGHSDAQVAKELGLSVAAVKGRRYRQRKKQRARDPTPDQTGIQENMRSLAVEKVIEEPSPIPPDWIRPLRHLILQELDAMTQAPSAQRVQRDDSPPVTPREGKKYVGERQTLPGARVDKVLHDLFEKERWEMGGSASKAMQKILWHYFGRPKLSFQDE